MRYARCIKSKSGLPHAVVVATHLDSYSTFCKRCGLLLGPVVIAPALGVYGKAGPRVRRDHERREAALARVRGSGRPPQSGTR